MLALVTGATGFLGGRLVRRLSARGDRVRVLARATSDLAGLPTNDVEITEGDVTDADAVARAVADAAVVYHLAARNDLGEPDPELMRRVNVDGTRFVLEAATANNAVAVYVSSVAALGPTGTSPESESWWSPTVPDSAYARTKRSAHVLALDIAARGGRVRTLMPGYIYGPGDPTPMRDLLARFLESRVPVGHLPDFYNSLVHVEDCADLLVRAAAAGRDGDTYIAAAQAVPMRIVYDTLAAVAGTRHARLWMRPGVLKALSGTGAAFSAVTGISASEIRESVAMSCDVHWSFSGRKARRELGWRPRSLAAGLADFAADLRSQAVPSSSAIARAAS